MKNLLFVCDFNSIHSRNLISQVHKTRLYNISVLSSFEAEEMNGIKLLSLNKGGFGDKSSFKGIASVILKVSPSIYRFIVTYFLARRTKKGLQKIASIDLPENIDIIHALRTQPEGILASKLVPRYNSKFFLTTWGQDFILWSKLNIWLTLKTKAVLKSVDVFLPDNYRDDMIIKRISGRQKIKSLVIPATGGLDFPYLEKIDTSVPLHTTRENSFLTTRGHDNAYINLTKVITAFEKIKKEIPLAHLYIDLNNNVDETKYLTLQKLIERKNLSENVSLLHLSRIEMFRYMRHCKYHVSVTYSDGMPLSLLESLYFGQVPIVYDHESTRILEKQFENYFSFSNYSDTNICKAWKKAVIESSNDYVQNTEKNRKILKNHYSREENVDKLIELYEKSKV